ncbi:MAG: hypothetical protein ACRD4S_01035 [Candidatus Acidiferrales bacterium]
MSFRKPMLLAVCLAFAAAGAEPALAQSNCTASQAAAIQCFVSNAVATHMTALRYGMSLSQFQTYGVAVSLILQTQHSYVVLAGLSSAIADAMPPTNADGSANLAEQDIAVSQIISAAVADNFATPPPTTSLQDVQWFVLDLVSSMNDNGGYISLLTPGVALRLIDSYVVTATSNGSVNWTQVDSSLATTVKNLIATGLIKVPSSMTSTQITAFVESLAHTIYGYKVATGRKTL